MKFSGAIPESKWLCFHHNLNYFCLVRIITKDSVLLGDNGCIKS